MINGNVKKIVLKTIRGEGSVTLVKIRCDFGCISHRVSHCEVISENIPFCTIYLERSILRIQVYLPLYI